MSAAEVRNMKEGCKLDDGLPLAVSLISHLQCLAAQVRVQIQCAVCLAQDITFSHAWWPTRGAQKEKKQEHKRAGRYETIYLRCPFVVSFIFRRAWKRARLRVADWRPRPCNFRLHGRLGGTLCV